MACLNPPFPNGSNYSAMNARKKLNADPTALNDADLMKENLRLRKELEEARKENLFLKKAAAFFAKEIG